MATGLNGHYGLSVPKLVVRELKQGLDFVTILLLQTMEKLVLATTVKFQHAIHNYAQVKQSS